jgi:hypothetical protein
MRIPWLPLRSRLITAAAAVVSGAMLVLALGSPAHAIYAKMSNTLDAPTAIGGVLPTGQGLIDQCRSPGYFFDLSVDVDNVNLSNGTALTVAYGGTEDHPEDATTLGTLTLNDGAGHFAGSKAGPAGANDNLYILHDSTIILTATDRWWADQLTC